MTTASMPPDDLTGLLTRTDFETALAQALRQAQEIGAPLSLAFFDIDHFLQVNERFAHQGGDVVLKRLAQLLQSHLQGGLAGRYGGDEFCVIFPGVEREQALLRMEAFRAEVAAQPGFEEGGVKVEMQVTISGGIAAYPIDSEEASDLLRKADTALYRAKLSGRNKIVLAYEERMVPKTAHFPQSQLERLAALARKESVSEAVLLREALDDLLTKYEHGFRA